jgi:hypothetical protein
MLYRKRRCFSIIFLEFPQKIKAVAIKAFPETPPDM